MLSVEKTRNQNEKYAHFSIKQAIGFACTIKFYQGNQTLFSHVLIQLFLLMVAFGISMLVVKKRLFLIIINSFGNGNYHAQYNETLKTYKSWRIWVGR